jgi:tetratricopeptide (TPR) repeat protein
VGQRPPRRDRNGWLIRSELETIENDPATLEQRITRQRQRIADGLAEIRQQTTKPVLDEQRPVPVVGRPPLGAVEHFKNRGREQEKIGQLLAARPSSQDEGQPYIIQPGDRLQKLARNYYGDASAWPVIWLTTNTRAKTDSSLTAISDPDHIQVGQKVWLPAAVSVEQILANYATSYNRQGTIHYEQEDLAGAIADFNWAIALDPDDASTYYNRGRTYRALKQYDLAITDFNQAIALKPDIAVYYRDRGEAYTNLKDYDSAMADYNQAIALDPDFPVYYNDRGWVYTALKQYDLAIADYTQAITLNPDYAEAHDNRDRIHAP